MEFRLLNYFPSPLRTWHGRNHTGSAAACWCPVLRAAHARMDRKIHPGTAKPRAAPSHPGQAALTLVQTCLTPCGSTFSTPLEIQVCWREEKERFGKFTNALQKLALRCTREFPNLTSLSLQAFDYSCRLQDSSL